MKKKEKKCISLRRGLLVPCLTFRPPADVDECAESAECSHGCKNTDGSYTCTCPAGLTLDTDLITCVGKLLLATCFNVNTYSYQEEAILRIYIISNSDGCPGDKQMGYISR